MAKPAKDKFDPKTFLAKVGAGKSISKLGKGQNVFVQGDVADAVFYIQKGKIKLTVVSDQAMYVAGDYNNPILTREAAAVVIPAIAIGTMFSHFGAAPLLTAHVCCAAHGSLIEPG